MTFREYTEKFGISLTAQQEEAVQRVNGNTLLLAVPGSGKTTVIVSRLGYMFYCLGIPHSSVLTLTYNVSACRDMKQRYISYFGDALVPQFRTIHGICAIIINEYAEIRGTTPFSLISDEQNASKLLSEIYIRVCGQYPEAGVINELKKNITYARNMMLCEKEILEISDGKYDLVKIMDEYTAQKKRLGLMDYDDQLEFALKILRTQPDILDFFRRKYRYINVDEAQDTSKIQHSIISLLAVGNLFMVGDEDQSIYGFRAAYPKALLDFEKNHNDAKVLLLEENFRSTGKILKRAYNLISNNKDRHKKHLYTKAVDGEDIEIINIPDRVSQYDILCSEAEKVSKCNEKTAVLFRNNDSALPLIARLEKNGIPYSYREKDSPFFENPGIHDIIMLLDVVYDNSKESFLSVAKRLGCGLTDRDINNICRLSKNTALSVTLRNYIAPGDKRYSRTSLLCNAMEWAKKSSPVKAINTLCDNTCFGKFLYVRIKDIKSKINILTDLASGCRTKRELYEKLSLLKNAVTQGKQPEENSLIISTIHSSKGLEYDNVYIIDAKDGEFPSVENPERCTKEEMPVLEEERRLFYVAVTRAKKSLKIIRYATEFDGTLCRKSTFIRELMRYSVSSSASSNSLSGVNGNVSYPAEDLLLSEFSEGTAITHRAYGKGIIKSRTGDRCNIQFQDGSTKTFSLPIAVSAGQIEISPDKKQ